MAIFSRPKSTRGQFTVAALHVAFLGVALALAWRHDGPPAEKAFWAILSYFVEIAVAGVVEIIAGTLRGRGDPEIGP